MQSIERTKQITNQLQSANQQRNYANNMAPTNNPELTMDKVFPVKDKVALVTGGGSGIGLMITQTLAVNGAKVYIVGRTEEKLEKVVEVHGQNIAGQIIPIVGDVSTKEGVSKIKKEIESKEKCVCILVNNAGIAPGKTEVKGSSEELVDKLFNGTTEQEWLDVYQTNVVGPFLMSTAFLPLLEKSTESHPGYSGTIINISSISGHIRISQGHFAYNSSKGAAIHLNKMLASEIAKNGIKVRVNSIAPGVFPSEMTTQESRDDNQKSEMPKDHKEGLPAQRPGKDQDMAAAILFAVGCQYLNGQTVTVDGGYAIQVGN
jgi:NAD(P)-dependent dehydrogenase (short-subunit alcohol dehydrogenase family)